MLAGQTAVIAFTLGSIFRFFLRTREDMLPGSVSTRLGKDEPLTTKFLFDYCMGVHLRLVNSKFGTLAMYSPVGACPFRHFDMCGVSRL